MNENIDISEKFIEIEYRTKGNFEFQLRNFFKIDIVRSYNVFDDYILFNNNTGHLKRLRKVETENETLFQYIEKTPSFGHFEEKIFNLTELEYLDSLKKLHIIGSIKGNRKVLKSGDLKFGIDNIVNLGIYTEFEKTIEVTDDKSSIQFVINEIIGIMNQIGINNSQIINSSYPSLLGFNGGY